MDEEEFLREYRFPSAGYIPGIPGIWPGGSVVTVDERTNCVVRITPGHMQVNEAEVEQEQTPETPPALPESNAPDNVALEPQTGQGAAPVFTLNVGNVGGTNA